MTRGLQVVFCALLLTLTSSPAWGVCRPENRVWKIFSEPSKTASADLDQTLEPRGESAGCGYDFASGVHKYLYAQDDPIMMVDPTGRIGTIVEFDASTLINSYIESGIANVTANAIIHAILGQQYSGKEIVWDFTTGGALGASSTITKVLAGNLGTTWVAKLAFQGGRHGVNALIGTAEAYLKNESEVGGEPAKNFNLTQFATVFMINYSASVAGDFAEAWSAPIIKKQKTILVNAVMRNEIRSLTDLRNWLNSTANTSTSSVSAGERVFYGSLRSIVDKAIPQIQKQTATAEGTVEKLLNLMQESILETGKTAANEWASP